MPTQCICNLFETKESAAVTCDRLWMWTVGSTLVQTLRRLQSLSRFWGKYICYLHDICRDTIDVTRFEVEASDHPEAQSSTLSKAPQRRYVYQ